LLEKQKRVYHVKRNKKQVFTISDLSGTSGYFDGQTRFKENQ